MMIPWLEIDSITNQLGMDRFLVAAIICQESACNPNAMRFEPKWAYYMNPDEFAEAISCTVETERVCQSISWGYMQVMGAVARELGVIGWLSELLKPELNIQIGVSKLDQLMSRYSDTSDVISAYNAGTPRKNNQGIYSNQSYVEHVLYRIEQIKSTK